MKIHTFVRIFCLSLFITSCAVNNINKANSNNPSTENPTATAASSTQTSTPSEGFYFFKISKGPPFTYSMAYAPKECLQKPQKCTNIEIIFDFPKENSDLSGSVLNWSPDNTRAIFVSMKSVLSYTPPATEFETLATDLSITSNVAPWSQDQHWVALSIEDTPYSNHILLLDPVTLETRVLMADNNRLLFVYNVEWKNNHELLVEVHDSGDPADPETKKLVVRKFLAVIDIDTNTWTVTEEIPLD